MENIVNAEVAAGLLENGCAADQLIDPISDVRAYEIMRDELASALYEFDDIALRQNPRIEARYSMMVGIWERGLKKASLEARRARRRYEIAKELVEAGHAIIEEAIEMQVDLEVGSSSRQLAVNAAHSAHAFETCVDQGALTDERYEQAGALYHMLVKRLHPQVNPAASALEEQYLLQAQASFAQSDVDGLRDIEAATRSMESAVSPAQGMSPAELSVECELMAVEHSVAQCNICHLKKTYPYLYGTLIDDSGWMTTKATTLRARIDEAHAQLKHYRALYNELRGRA